VPRAIADALITTICRAETLPSAVVSPRAHTRSPTLTSASVIFSAASRLVFPGSISRYSVVGETVARALAAALTLIVRTPAETSIETRSPSAPLGFFAPVACAMTESVASAIAPIPTRT